MNFITLLATVVLAIHPALAVTVSYDPVYDSRDTSLVAVACSNGAHGLMKRGFTTFGSLPTFPNIGGAKVIDGWDSPQCGTCWNLTYTQPGSQPNTITITAIDSSHTTDFNIGQKAMDTLTNNQAVADGVVDAESVQVPASYCGL